MSTAAQTSSAIADALRIILAPGQVTECRILDGVTASDRRPQTYSGYFDDADKLATAVKQIKSAKGFYFVLNPVHVALLGRAYNKIRAVGKEPTTSDADILSRGWLPIDCDAKRPSGVSASNNEHTAALEKALAIRDELSRSGWPMPLFADSGNGAHLLYRVDLPRDDGGLVKRCLEALAKRFDDEQVSIDRTVFNPARIWKLYGTLAGKGDPEGAKIGRPQRPSKLIEAPMRREEPVSRELLEALAAEVPVESTKPQATLANGHFDIDNWIVRNGLEARGPEPYQGGRKWIMPTCPWNESHTNGSAFIIQRANGVLQAGCHHNGCHGKGWHDLRDAVEPGWRERRKQYRGNGNTSAQNTEKTTLPLPLPTKEATPYTPFPLDVLPGGVGTFVAEAATAIGCDASFVALPTLACLARAIGNKRAIRLKRSWQEPAIVWAAIVGKSGTHKSPAIAAATIHLQRKQAEAMAQYQEDVRTYDQDRARYDRDYAAWKRNKSTEPPPWEPIEPALARYIVSDITIEALADRLHRQFDGVLVVRDELAGWLGGIAEYKGGQGSDLGHWLASWSAAPLTVDRKTGAIKTVHVPRAAVNIVGGIQPGVLRTAIGREHMQDGLCARLLLAMPENKPVRWSESTVSPTTEAALGKVFERLLSLEPAADEEGNPAPFAMPLTPEAKEAWVAYYNRHRAELAELDDDLAAAWSKLEAYAARFALIFQLAAWAAGEASGDAVDESSMAAGIRLADWFGGEARRVYGLFGETEQDREGRELVELIQRKGGKITARELAHACRLYRAGGEAEAALERLTQSGTGKWEVEPTPGRSRTTFILAGNSGNGNTSAQNAGETTLPLPLPELPGGNGEANLDEINTMLAEAAEAGEDAE